MPDKIIPPSKLKLIGSVVGQTVIIGFEYVKAKNKPHLVLMARQRCKCGSEILTRPTEPSKYCKNCYKGFKTLSPKTHGRTRTPEHTSWDAMKSRCYNKKNPAYHNYGGRGITICERWLDNKKGFSNFLEDVGERPNPKHLYSIDRINNEGNYEPGNCRWATKKDQINNKRKNVLTYDKSCIVCCKEYSVMAHQLRRIYCSRTCQGRAYLARLKLKQHPPEKHP